MHTPIYHIMAVSIYSYTFKSVKMKKNLQVSKWSQKSFMKISENYTFESVKIESV